MPANPCPECGHRPGKGPITCASCCEVRFCAMQERIAAERGATQPAPVVMPGSLHAGHGAARYRGFGRFR